MKQQAFVERYAERGARFVRAREALDGRELGLGRGRRRRAGDARTPDLDREFPRLYRELCHDLALARSRGYSPALQSRLNALALAGHRHLYWRQNQYGLAIARFIAHGFPARLRADRAYVAVATALFALPGALLYLLVIGQPEMIYSFMSAEEVRGFESMYDPTSERVGTNRDAGSDVYMFGFYIMNNIGVGFRTFASGLLVGIGSAFFLVFNGMLLGGVAAHIVNLDYGITFFPFVIGHGSVELTGIIISGAAGLKLGHAIVAPGALTRVQALRTAAAEALLLVYGVILMLVLAALIEAFWSSKGAITPEMKLAVGSLLWALVFTYFLFLGRPRRLRARAGRPAGAPAAEGGA